MYLQTQTIIRHCEWEVEHVGVQITYLEVAGDVNATSSCLRECRTQNLKSPVYCRNTKLKRFPSVEPVFCSLSDYSTPVCLSDSVSSVQLFNCIIKPFSYSSRSVSEPPPVPARSPLQLALINETAQALPLPPTF